LSLKVFSHFSWIF